MSCSCSPSIFTTYTVVPHGHLCYSGRHQFLSTPDDGVNDAPKRTVFN